MSRVKLFGLFVLLTSLYVLFGSTAKTFAYAFNSTSVGGEFAGLTVYLQDGRNSSPLSAVPVNVSSPSDGSYRAGGANRTCAAGFVVDLDPSPDGYYASESGQTAGAGQPIPQGQLVMGNGKDASGGPSDGKLTVDGFGGCACALLVLLGEKPGGGGFWDLNDNGIQDGGEGARASIQPGAATNGNSYTLTVNWRPTPPPPPPPPPSQPNTPIAIPRCSGINSQVEVSWSGGDGGSGFNVDLDDNPDDSDGWWYKSNTTSPTILPTTGMGRTTPGPSPPDSTLVGGSTYRTKIYSNASGTSSGWVSFVAKKCSPPNTPTATPQCSGTNSQVQVSWTGGDGSRGFSADLDSNSVNSDGWWFKSDVNSPTTLPTSGMAQFRNTELPPSSTLVAGNTYRTKIYSWASDTSSGWTSFVAANCDVPPPPTDTAPILSITENCTTKQAKVRVTDADGTNGFKGSMYSVDAVNVNGFPKNETEITIDMAGKDQTVAHPIHLESKGVGASGAAPTVPLQKTDKNYGPCVVVAPESFNIELTPKVSNLQPNEETPTSANFARGAKSNRKVNDITLTRRYYKKTPAGAETNILIPTNQSVSLNLEYGPEVDTRSFSPVVVNLGDKICMQLTADPGSGKVDAAGTITERGAVNTKDDCIGTGAKPYFRVYNGDVAVGFDTCPAWFPSGSSNKLTGWNDEAGKGAGVQLAALVSGTIKDFTSATGRLIDPTNPPHPPKGLTFAKADPEIYGGLFGKGFCPDNYFAKAPDATAGPASVDPTLLPEGNSSYKYDALPGLTLTVAGAGTISGSKTLYVDGDVYINTDIKYRPSFDIATVPKFTLVANGNIYIDKGAVGQLDGVYIAQPKSPTVGGMIYTCANGLNNVPIGKDLLAKCNKKLTINGLFIAKQVKLLRTKGTLSTSVGGNAEVAGSDNIAESFMLSPESWLVKPGGILGAGANGTYDTIDNPPPVL